MPQPVDFPTEVAKTTAAQRIQELSDRAALLAQQRMASEADEARVRSETQVQQTDESENPEVDGEGKRKNPFAKRRRKKDDQGQDSEPPVPGALGESHQLDVRG